MKLVKNYIGVSKLCFSDFLTPLFLPIWAYCIIILSMLTESLTLLSLGFILGLEHAFDADHLAAVSTLISKHKNLKTASILGAIWGLGHTTTLFIVGAFIMVLKITIPEKIALSLEFIVAIVIVILGISVIKNLFVNKKHVHTHTHEGNSHIHGHSHKQTKSHNHSHKSFIVGMIHGMAGSAALMLLVLSTIKSTLLGLIYILVFGIGSVVGMTLASTLISLPFIVTAKKISLWNERIRWATGVFSILFGTFLMIKIALLASHN